MKGGDMMVQWLKNFFLSEKDLVQEVPVLHNHQRPKYLEVNKWALSPIVQRVTGIVGTKPYPIDELMLMAAAFYYHLPDVVIDIGTHQGKSARVWYELGALLPKMPTIHTIDLFSPDHPEYPGKALGQYIRRTKVRQHYGDGETVAREILSQNPTGNYLLFLDGDHSYETVRRELELARVFSQGCLLVHDTFYQSDCTYNIGPHQAIENFVSQFTVKQVIHLATGLPGMSYIGVD